MRSGQVLVRQQTLLWEVMEKSNVKCPGRFSNVRSLFSIKDYVQASHTKLALSYMQRYFTFLLRLLIRFS